ncbi:MAG: ABC transporter ATP-binding protein [Acidobacteriales bacterium]|nr:ABC transporter ATP-binding protein [Terriglobales bacterium]
MVRSPHEVLSVRLTVDYPAKPGVLKGTSFHINRGEVLGLVGTSGSGKSTLALSILRLLNFKGGKASGEVRFGDNDLMQLSERQMRALRGCEIGLVLQSPISSLNPALRIGWQMREAWNAHAQSSKEWKRRVLAAFESVSLPTDDGFLRRYPSEISVGQGQRVLTAMAILHHPSLLIADEPTSALDVITQSEILQLFSRLNQQLGMAILYISHDLLSIASICHRLAILHHGEIVECAEVERIFSAPQHPYTRQLIAALPSQPLKAEAVTVRR